MFLPPCVTTCLYLDQNSRIILFISISDWSVMMSYNLHQWRRLNFWHHSGGNLCANQKKITWSSNHIKWEFSVSFSFIFFYCFWDVKHLSKDNKIMKMCLILAKCVRLITPGWSMIHLSITEFWLGYRNLNFHQWESRKLRGKSGYLFFYFGEYLYR